MLSGEQIEAWIVGLVIGFAIFGVYFLPTIVAARRGAERTSAIAALNILVGWTFLGWVAAFVWALADRTAPKAQA
ncbi:T4 superinfection immunity protein [Rhodopseudomonas faecalis]|uniref:T4 superinfection immunity protein n=1 Tax=Rhodopseudomonas faecalis TaxID=99655 RepID=A0A318TMH0_9BRAD|nr:superinfection immunity protein [Rhodopseudomonas faecalis]PYF05060.1 T4 superinfection immunity protein [Rhodopseudomonas faecalis]